MSESAAAHRVREILSQVRGLACEYYQLTGKPLGVTGEVAEYVAAELLGLDLAPPRTKGYDATRSTTSGIQRVQIKGRALSSNANASQRLGTIKRAADCDRVLLVLLDNATLEPGEIWEASYADVEARLAVPG